ncbi:sugar porter family MFS transporter [Thermogutta sp.]|uniref:sugar porter family MFS transporter n=1 Tax=Thermogutta sp. TaxID=1962930 RepID=UPI003220945D
MIAHVQSNFGAEPPPYQGRTGYVLLLTVVAALGGLLFGYDTAVIAGAIDYLTEHFRLSPELKGWATSNILLGCALGAAVAGPLADYLGRRWVLVLAAIFFAISAVGTAIPATLTQFVLARMLGGLAVGAAAIVSPLYIAEISPAHLRGRLVALQQIAIISGMVVVAVVNWLIALQGDHAWNVVTGWRWMFGSETLPAVLFLACLTLVPESPRWLIKMGRTEEALAVLTRLAGAERAKWEAEDIQRTVAEETGRLSELLRPGYRRILVIGVILAILQQVTGINAIVYYTPSIFRSSGSTDIWALFWTIITQAVNLSFTLVAIAVVDRLGRKPLLLLTSTAMGISLVLLGWAFYRQLPNAWVVVFIQLYMASFAVGMGPVVWVVLAEMFPTRTRGLAMGIATVALWLADFLITQTAPMMYAAWGPASAFWTYAVMCVACLVFVLLFVPETKGKTLEEIERSFLGLGVAASRNR